MTFFERTPRTIFLEFFACIARRFCFLSLVIPYTPVYRAASVSRLCNYLDMVSTVTDLLFGGIFT
jgi:hypothetical protein